MKNILFPLLITLFIFSCKKKEEQTVEIIEKSPSKTEIPFMGQWERSFEAGPGNQQTVLYSIYEDSIRYTLTGNVAQSNYKMIRDTFLLNENRFIGHTEDNIYYLIFTKDITNDSISIYKEIISNFNIGMSIAIPNDTTTLNHGWGVYNKI